VRTVEPDVPDDDLTAPTKFVSDPMHNGRLVVAAGQTFAAAGAFSVRYTPVDPSYADLRFAWTDRVRPTLPTLRAPTARIAAGRPFRVQWKPSRDTGSGLAFCLVRIDTRDALRVEEGASATAGPLMPGIHRISVSCTDRAGNRSRASAKRIRAVQG
jgi:hypothetical protein